MYESSFWKGLFVKKKKKDGCPIFCFMGLILHIFRTPSAKINFDAGKYLVGVKMKKKLNEERRFFG